MDSLEKMVMRNGTSSFLAATVFTLFECHFEYVVANGLFLRWTVGIIAMERFA